MLTHADKLYIRRAIKEVVQEIVEEMMAEQTATQAQQLGGYEGHTPYVDDLDYTDKRRAIGFDVTPQVQESEPDA